MVNFRASRKLSLCLLIASSFLMGCTAMRAHSDGLGLASSGQKQGAISKLHEAALLEPSNARYQMDYLNYQQSFENELVKDAQSARAKGQSEQARHFFDEALKIQPTSERALRGIESLALDVRRHRILSEAEKLFQEGQPELALSRARSVLAEDSSNAGAANLIAKIIDQQEKINFERTKKKLASTALKKPVTLQFQDATLRMVFEALARAAGLNVILDRDVRSDLRATIFVKDVSVSDAVDLILMQNELEKRVLSSNTILVYPATNAKQKQYQDLEVRTFHVSNADVKYLQSILKGVLKVKEVSVDERTNTLVARDTPEAIAVVAKVISAHDVPDPEVMLEVAVLEVSSGRLQNLGVQLPNSVTISVPNTNTSSSGGAASGTTIGELRKLTSGDFLVSPLSATLNLQMQDTDTNLLASPRIRARNKEKAKILIGDRVPTITNTVTPVQTGTPVITGSVQYQDVGLKLEFEPQVYSDHDVGIRISLEVSSIVKEFTDAQGGRSYQIGTRNAQTVLRLHDGETQVLAGLISDEDRNSADHIPLFGQIPLLGRLFSNNKGTRNKSEIVLSITPHIVRAPTVGEMDNREFFSGTEMSLRESALQLESTGEVKGPANAGGGSSGALIQPSNPIAQVNGAPGAGAAVQPPVQNATVPASKGSLTFVPEQGR